MHIVPAASSDSSGAPKTSGTPGSTGPRVSARFGAIFKRKLDTPKGTSDAAAQIAALLQQGVPLITVVDRIATQLVDATARSFSKPLDADAKATLKRAYASALAPPGASPPSTIAEQASALRERLRNLLGALVGGAKDAGQQSRFSGTILDATAAKDNPAPQPKLPIPTPSRTISSIIESLVQHAAAKAQPSAPAPAQAPTNLLERVIARAVRADGGVASSHPIAPANAEKLFNRLIGIISAAKADDAGRQNSDPRHDTTGERHLPSAFPTASAPRINLLPIAIGGQVSVAPPTSQSASGAQAPPLVSYSTLDPQAVLDQVIKGFTVRTSGEGSEVRLRLSPDHLGNVSLKLTVDGGTIGATLIAQNADVRDVLLQNQHQLARSLAEAGLSLGSFSVDVSGNNANGSDSQRQPAQGSGLRGRADYESDGDVDAPLDMRIASSSISGIRNPWLLNTLV